jgi:ABC-type sugar transport system permease subunit
MQYRFQKKVYRLEALLWLLPAVAVFGMFIVWPLINMVRTSFFDWNGMPNLPMAYVGLANYFTFFTDYAAASVIRNMGIMFVMHMLLTLPISFLMASIVNRRMTGVRALKAGYFLPTVINRVAIGMMFNFLILPRVGPITVMLRKLGFGTINLLGNLATVMPTITTVEIWSSCGFYMILFLAGMVAIPEDLYEAGAIDGVNAWQRLCHITIPSLRQTFRIVIVLILTGAFKIFDFVMVLTSGGPGNVSEVPATVIYKRAFLDNRFGYADSIATMTVVACLLITIAFNWIFREREVS